jgi:hypothetical protein
MAQNVFCLHIRFALENKYIIPRMYLFLRSSSFNLIGDTQVNIHLNTTRRRQKLISWQVTHLGCELLVTSAVKYQE